MQLTFTNLEVDQLRAKLPSDIAINWGFSTSSSPDAERHIEVPTKSLKFLRAVRTAMQDLNMPTTMVSRYINALDDPTGGGTIPSLQGMSDMITRFFSRAVKENSAARYLVREEDGLDGLVFLPISVAYEPPTNRHGSEGSVVLTLAYRERGYQEMTLRFHKRDTGSTVSELLARQGFGLMTEAYEERYATCLAKYNKLKNQHKHQVLVKGVATSISPVWWRGESYDMAPGGRPTRAVLDWRADDNTAVEAATTSLTGEKIIPIHPVVPVFSLAHHVDVLVNVANVASYRYDMKIKEKLVLPESHSRLLDALISDLDLFVDSAEQSDILQNKTRANIILAHGRPGTGKTLTAEVYAELVKRPLYEVASGQLGSHADQLDERLDEVLRRSIDLDMPLVINEADVFVRPRNDDVVQNAICATFLRQLEYHQGLVFLTTNREADEAIRSRCVAEISFGVPSSGDRRRLWEVQLREFGVTLDEHQITLLVKRMPTVVGRDIQNLLRLTIRVCAAHKLELTAQRLVENAVFKSIEVVTS